MRGLLLLVLATLVASGCATPAPGATAPPCARLGIEALPPFLEPHGTVTLRVRLENCGDALLEITEGGRCQAATSLGILLRQENETFYLYKGRNPEVPVSLGLFGVGCGPPGFEPPVRVVVSPGGSHVDEYVWNGTLLAASRCPTERPDMWAVCARETRIEAGAHELWTEFALGGDPPPRELPFASAVLDVRGG